MAYDMFIKIGDLKGEARDHVHKDEIDVLSWNWGMSQSGTMHIGGGGGSGKVNIQDLSFTKYVDSCTTNLMLKCCDGKHFPDAHLVVRKAGESPIEYYKVDMEDVLITSVTTGGSGGDDRLTETVSLNFAKVCVLYTPQDETGAAGGTMDMRWDIEANVGG